MGLQEEVRLELTDRIIPFWKSLRDDCCGGYYGYVDFDLNVEKDARKGCILNSRILWFFSNAAEIFHEDGLLLEAHHGYEFLVNHCLDREYGGVYWDVLPGGKAADDTKHTYNQAFAVYALTSYYRVSGREEALQYAMDLFHMIEGRCRDTYGYRESFTRKWEPETNEKLSENGLLADKTMNTLLHILEAYTELYRVSQNETVGQALEDALIQFRDLVYNKEKVQLEVFFDDKLQSISDLYSYGHDIEASWLLDRAADILGKARLEQETKEYTRKLAEALYRRALNEDGSMNNECFQGNVDDTRVWWVQAEALVGFYNCYQKTEEEKYLQAAKNLWQYIKSYLIDKREGGEWFWDVDSQGKPSSQKPIAEPWKCPYHNGRMCLEIIRRTENVT